MSDLRKLQKAERTHCEFCQNPLRPRAPLVPAPCPACKRMLEPVYPQVVTATVRFTIRNREEAETYVGGGLTGIELELVS